ncbi:MAG: hypothetical protein GX879_09770 [Bacteroidales bacterium]|nr:hypothetical protein [Bacteroidales bacterium]
MIFFKQIRKIVFGLFLILLNIAVHAQKYEINSIQISGNEKTKEQIILRKIPFSAGDSLSINYLENEIINIKQRLELLGLFNFVDISYSTNNQNNIDLNIELIERWYLWIYPILEVGDLNFDTYISNKKFDRINYGLSLEKHNFQGKNQLIKIKLRLGFKEQYSLSYFNEASNINPKLGYFVGTDFFRMKESIIASKNFEPVYYSKNEENPYIFRHINAYTGLSYKLNLSTRIKSKFAYNQYSSNIEYEGFGDNNFRFFELSGKFENDKRTNKYFPVSGHLLSFEIAKLGLIKYTNYYSVNQLILDLNFDFYQKLGQKFFYSTQSNFVYHYNSEEHTNFWLYRSIGYNNYLRGLDNLIINTEAHALARNSIRYNIFERKRSEVKLTGLKQFDVFYFTIYANAFCDIAFTKPHGLIMGAGAGIDLVTYYDRTLSFYYAYNNLNQNFNIFVQYKSPFIKYY